MHPNNTNISLIYVFGPKRQWQDYLKGKKVDWLKIGRHSCPRTLDKWEEAVKYINGIAHTGIPEICRVYEVFTFPLMPGDFDDKFRRILTDDMFTLDNSKALNKLPRDPYEIKAGDEFVYNVDRNQIANARKSFEHGILLDLLSNCPNPDSDIIRKLIIDNQISPFDTEDTDGEEGKTPTERKGNPDPLMKKLYESLPEEIRKVTILNKGERYRYLLIHSSRKGFWYSAAYSIRSRQIGVAYETYGGLQNRDMITSFISEKGISIPGMTIEQGTKNLEKWSWRVTGTLDQDEENIIKWYVDNIEILYNSFG